MICRSTRSLADDLNNDQFERDRPGPDEGFPSLLGRNSYRGDSFSTLDMRLSYVVRAGSNLEFEIIGEVFNAFNSDNFRSFEDEIFDDGELNDDFPSASECRSAEVVSARFATALVAKRSIALPSRPTPVGRFFLPGALVWFCGDATNAASVRPAGPLRGCLQGTGHRRGARARRAPRACRFRRALRTAAAGER